MFIYDTTYDMEIFKSSFENVCRQYAGNIAGRHLEKNLKCLPAVCRHTAGNMPADSEKKFLEKIFKKLENIFLFVFY